MNLFKNTKIDRDTLNLAVKGTCKEVDGKLLIEVKNYNHIISDGYKKSSLGILSVSKDGNGKYHLFRKEKKQA